MSDLDNYSMDAAKLLLQGNKMMGDECPLGCPAPLMYLKKEKVCSPYVLDEI